MVGYVKLGLAVVALVVVLIAGKTALDWYADWRYEDDLIDALNAAAEADSTRKVFEDSVSGLAIYQERARIATSEKELARQELEAERRLRKEQGLEIQQLTHTNARLQASIRDTTTGRTVGDSLVVGIDASDGPVLVRGDVVVAAKVDPPDPFVRYDLTATAKLTLRERVLRDPDSGAIFTEITSPDPQITIEDVDTIVDKSVTKFGRKGFFSFSAGGIAAGLSIGVPAGIVACLAVCP